MRTFPALPSLWLNSSSFLKRVVGLLSGEPKGKFFCLLFPFYSSFSDGVVDFCGNDISGFCD